MAIQLKHPDQIEKMYAACQVVKETLDRIGEIITPGITTAELDKEAERICHECGAICLFKGYPGPPGAIPFPGNICSSLNEQVVHGIPCDHEICDGDIVSVDFGVVLDGWCGDAARTFMVGQVEPQTRRLVEVTQHTLDVAIELAAPGGKWSVIAGAMADYVRSNGFSVVEDYVGHGIGRDMHEDPQVPNFVSRGLRYHDFTLRPGLCVAVEPMVNMGTHRTKVLRDGWTVVTADGKPSAHWEHTIAIVEDGVRVLTA